MEFVQMKKNSFIQALFLLKSKLVLSSSSSVTESIFRKKTIDFRNTQEEQDTH